MRLIPSFAPSRTLQATLFVRSSGCSELCSRGGKKLARHRPAKDAQVDTSMVGGVANVLGEGLMRCIANG